MVVRMTMTTVPVWLEVDGERVAEALQQAGEHLGLGEGGVFLDFSAVRRIDPRSLAALGKLAGMADAKAVKVSLRGVKVDIYRVLKLSRLTSRFTFVA